jgi:hypothetical protein
MTLPVIRYAPSTGAVRLGLLDAWKLAVSQVSVVNERAVSELAGIVTFVVRRTRTVVTVASSVESIEPSTISLLPAEFGARSAAVRDALKTSAPVTASAAICGSG